MKTENRVIVRVCIEEYADKATERKESCKECYRKSRSPEMLKAALWWNTIEVQLSKAMEELNII